MVLFLLFQFVMPGNAAPASFLRPQPKAGCGLTITAKSRASPKPEGCQVVPVFVRLSTALDFGNGSIPRQPGQSLWRFAVRITVF
ncbi:hypothetical protein [Rhodobacter sp. SY28-1]|uniref:hypothetical protein n=1 Tax=Rhodobacter sp. SY28-1 TaxID=2562317 RepID=UPI001485405F|nr:hypothetical protein [Rhodobacter sp. SY28-1]